MNLSGHHKKTLAKIFVHPVSHNVEWREALSLLEHVAAIERERDGRVRAFIGDHEVTLHPAHHHHAHVLSEQEVLDLRRGLSAAGITPERDE